MRLAQSDPNNQEVLQQTNAQAVMKSTSTGNPNNSNAAKRSMKSKKKRRGGSSDEEEFEKAADVSLTSSSFEELIPENTEEIPMVLLQSEVVDDEE